MIDAKKQAELRRRFNPDGSELRQMQLRMLDMLKYVDHICTENNITYWLSSGTCLGAVRHGGFIPWDDDCDIEMFRDDFIRLRDTIVNDPDSPFLWQDHSTDPAYLAPYAKLRDPLSTLQEVTYNDRYYTYHGIYVDIFIIEPSRSRFISKLGNFIQGLGLFRLNLIKNKFLRKSLVWMNWNLIHGIIFPVLNLTNILSSSNELYRHTMGSMFLKPRKRSAIGLTKRTAFEGVMLPIPEDSPRYLMDLYGDYNKLPDIDKIRPHISKVEIR